MEDIKIIGKLKEVKTTAEGKELIFVVENKRHTRMIDSLKDESYSISIGDLEKDRTLRQNRYMWALLTEIDRRINGDRGLDPERIYCQMLREVGAKTDYLVLLTQAEPMLRRMFRAVEYVAPYVNPKDKKNKYGVYRVYWGSSEFNTKEMTLLIDHILDYAERIGIETDYWVEVLK